MSRSLPHLTLTTKHKFSLTYLTYLSDVLSLTVLSFGARSIKTLRRFTRGQGRQLVSKERIDVYDGRVGTASKRLCICVEDRFLRRGEPEAHFRNFKDDVVNSMTTPLEDDESLLFGVHCTISVAEVDQR